MDAQFWDERYSSRDQLFSGRPNGVLVTEVSGLPPGQALDVGCGEGGDAIWLARRGWRVTALDISTVALRRAAKAAADAGVADRIAWTRTDLAVTHPPAQCFDLVSAQYFPLLRRDGDAALRGLLAAVAPGGILLVTGHDTADWPAPEEGGHDPRDFFLPSDIAALLGDEWTIEVDETRARVDPAPEGTRHARDTVLRARRRPA
ncbi:SAM-dependent methyltransferase [Prauserella sp. PE36]|uniref:class I SAM-dependent methyltransferase n=1 Tax=Prauserella sp. PE36 TaxID=1504709 RepID=UPI000D924B8E|nr:class I SAM-dependent methyltransferase [Prauserella sp. PE36]PXY30366.1 SAM-dependent methyltransferase [Prauserella coralliicola]RBM21043.1 SAM-dependent methyltransferase [Prauserella sp. PE36]